MGAHRLLIGGELVKGDRVSGVVNPATGEIFAECPRASPAQLEQAVAAGSAAFSRWSRLSFRERGAALAQAADVLDRHAGELAHLLTREQGKPLSDALSEVNRSSEFFRYFSCLEWEKETIEDSAARRVEIHRTPLGVAAAVVPWNYPLLLMAFKVPAALIAGNTVVLKPAATTPLTTLRFAELVKDVFPPGVINVIADENDLGALLVRHPDVRKVSFTGATPTGKEVMAAAAADLKRVTLELGGNDPAIVLDDVEPGEVASQVFRNAFRNNGQVCVAIKRAYVHDAVYDAVCDALVQLANTTIVGNGLDAGVQLGPLQNHKQLNRVQELIADARKCGTVICGGQGVGEAGYFVRPTIVRDIPAAARVVQEEQFGPVLPVIRFSDPEDAIRLANDSDYGLAGSVWSGSEDRAYSIAAELDAGTVWINKHADLSPHIPFCGSKQSGVGVELGMQGIAEFSQLKVVNVARS